MTTTVQQTHFAGKAPAYLKGLFESPVLRFASVAVGSVVAAATFLLVLATPAKANSATISEGFKTSTQLVDGSVVSVDQNNPEQVVLANLNNAQYTAGVVLPLDNSLLTLREQASNVQIATAGEATLFVTDSDGEIAVGDFLSASALSGVARKVPATFNGRIIGIAKEAFNATSTAETVQTNSGDFRVGSIQIELSIFDNQGNDDAQGENESLLVSFTRRITGKSVSVIRAVIAFAIFFAAITVSSFLLFGSTRGMFISIGRNPLSAPSIFSGLINVNVISLIIVLVGVVAAYGMMAV